MMGDLTGPRAELARLIEERREDFAGLSRLLGRNAAYVQQFIKRGVPRKLAEKDRATLARYFAVDESLFGGPPNSAQRSEGMVVVPRLDVRASAGHGAFSESEVARGALGFDPSYLRRISQAPPERLSIIRVRGDSMAPTLVDGEDIMVDCSPNAAIADGIYVLRRDDILSVKRLAVHPGTRRLTVSSDNPAYPTWRDCDPFEMNVVGRVVWAARKVG